MSISADKIKELRSRTQAGFMDCKKALEESDNDIEKAIAWLREKGISKAAKKASAIAAEGQTTVVEKGDNCVVLEVNSQTDFVSKNADFVKFVKDVAEVILKNKSADNVDSLVLPNKKTVADTAIDLTATIGEKISVRRAQLLTKKKGQSFGVYQHFNGRISAAVLIDGEVSSEVGKDVAMQVASMNPKFVNSSQVDKKWKDEEEKLLIQKTIEEGKPKEFAEKIVAGRMVKMLAEVCLEEQPFIKDNGITIIKYLKQNKANKVLEMVRFEVGEGIEKQEANFADEVKAQMKK
ncbi:elongation factor Ts [Malacoplasma penetrans]|uniref:Elongation factor Ts n=1 Tax=Malacoplasma penetrans (strain HF-2) TaxID=272633 RepID=EFTS_MALP2|nr:translation elongation factor Ts [Malacoplasma penetrans]Q8EUG8.1 RecName: Full=Elongation factor Ts; Short=EF-Ts [Malacoplasma penetrans HF-2]RXY96072.1 elongation factor Ts [Malacoplasma penetrans]BAC44745.1 elongation factor Ts [Malacoplasma penetrans HF-2]